MLHCGAKFLGPSQSADSMDNFKISEVENLFSHTQGIKPDNYFQLGYLKGKMFLKGVLGRYSIVGCPANSVLSTIFFFLLVKLLPKMKA